MWRYMSHMILLGAGASVEAKLPTAKELTKKLLNSFPDESQEKRVLEFVQNRIKKNEKDVVDIEQLLNAVEDIAHTLDLYTPLPLSELAFAEDLPRFSRNLVEKSKEALRDHLLCDKDKLSYLEPLADFLKKRKKTVIVTLNYDDVIERLFEKHDIHCFYGLDEDRINLKRELSKGEEFPKGEVKLLEEGVHLIKLHGSLNWYLEEVTLMGSLSASSFFIEAWRMDEVTRSNHPNARPAIIFGQRNKLTAEGPFPDLFLAFRDELRRTEKLTVIGYSFRDFHVNHMINKWINQARDFTLTNIGPYVDPYVIKDDLANSEVGTYVKDAAIRDNGSGKNELYYDPRSQGTGEGLKAIFGNQPDN